jgi:hypothetical protein
MAQRTKEQEKAEYWRLRNAGLCYLCGGQPESGKLVCDLCRIRRVERQRRYEAQRIHRFRKRWIEVVTVGGTFKKVQRGRDIEYGANNGETIDKLIKDLHDEYINKGELSWQAILLPQDEPTGTRPGTS